MASVGSLHSEAVMKPELKSDLIASTPLISYWIVDS